MKNILQRCAGIAAVIGLVALLIGFWTEVDGAPFFWAALTVIIFIQPIVEWLKYKESGRKIHLIIPILSAPILLFVLWTFFTR